MERSTVCYDLGEGRERWQVLSGESVPLEPCFEVTLQWGEALLGSLSAVVGLYTLTVWGSGRWYYGAIHHRNLGTSLGLGLSGVVQCTRVEYTTVPQVKKALVLALEQYQVSYVP